MSLAGSTVLVTGAGGFIGSHLTEALVRAGCRTRALVHYNALGGGGWLDHAELRSDIEVVSGDISDRDSVAPFFKDVQYIFHLAALIAIPYSYRAPLSYVRTNIEGTLNLLELARQQGCTRFIHTSTSEVYGTARSLPIDEDHPLQGQSPYSASKIGADKMAEAFRLSFGVPVTTVRPFNTFGPRQSARAIIPTIILQCLQGGPIKLGNLQPTRDLNYVANTVAGFISVAQPVAAIGETFNFGFGKDISMGDLARRIARLTGCSDKIETEDCRTRPEGSEVDRLLANSAKATRLLKWTPAVGLDEGLERTIEWLRQHDRLYRAEQYVV